MKNTCKWAEAQPATADPGASCKWCVATDALADAMLKPEEREKYMRDLDEWEQRNSHKYEAALSRLPAEEQFLRKLMEKHPAEIEKTPPSPEVHELQSKIRQCEDEQNSYRRAKQARIARVQADGQDMETIIKNQIDAGQALASAHADVLNTQ